MPESPREDWMKSFARARDKALRERWPSEEEFARLWAERVTERLKSAQSAQGFQTLRMAASAGAPGMRAEPFSAPVWWMGSERPWGVRFFCAKMQGAFTVGESWEWSVGPRLWGLPGWPLWASKIICKRKALALGGAAAWTQERLERACDEALAAYARKDARASGALEGHPPPVRALLEADALAEALRASAEEPEGRAPPSSGEKGQRGRL